MGVKPIIGLSIMGLFLVLLMAAVSIDCGVWWAGPILVFGGAGFAWLMAWLFDDM